MTLRPPVWTGLDVARWRRLADAARTVLQQKTPRGVSKAAFALLNRAVGEARTAVFPTRDPQEIGRYHELFKAAKAYVETAAHDDDRLRAALARAPAKIQPPGWVDPGQPVRQVRLPYRDD